MGPYDPHDAKDGSHTSPNNMRKRKGVVNPTDQNCSQKNIEVIYLLPVETSIGNI